MIQHLLHPSRTRKALALVAVMALACGQESDLRAEPARPAEDVGQLTGPDGPPARLPDNLRGARELRSQMANDPRVRNFVFSWAVSPDGIFSNTWLGIHTIQHPFDVWVTQEIMYEVKPDFIVETGTHHGGSAALWATIMDQINPNSRVITIDIEDKVTAAKDLPIVKSRVDFLIGSSIDPAIVAEVARLTSGGKVMVILDSLHTEEHVAKELEAYAPLVSVGSYLIVQDTGVGVAPRNWKYPGGGRAVAAFIARNDAFEIDESRERLVLTSNGRGFLKRVR